MKESTIVRRAARRFKDYLVEKNGGRLPRTVQGWRKLSDVIGVPSGPPTIYPDRFTARLFYSEKVGCWIIAFNARTSERQQRRFICHEIFEYLAIGDYPTLYEEVTTGFYYHGGTDPDSLHHNIAVRGERLCFRT